MRALVFDKNGLENLKVMDVEKPQLDPHSVLIRVRAASVNPVDYATVVSIRNVTPIPHIPGAEFAGVVEAVGDHVKEVKPGDRVAVYSRLFDGSCDMCLAGQEMLCRKGGLIGIVSNGGYAEYAVVPAKNVFRVSDNIEWELAASLSIGALTAYHALRLASVSPGEVVVVVGASGNTGLFAVQLAKIMGAKVVAVTRKQWLREFGADEVVDLDNAYKAVERISGGSMADVVIDPQGTQTISKSIKLLGTNGRVVTFGALTGDELRISIREVFSKQLRIIGSTGGTRREMLDLVRMAEERKLRVKVWRSYDLDHGVDALKNLFSSERDGKIMILP
ncbi:alcohol dehydrogenase [Desulfurococcaceae archaeon AG1]|jgi:2-desacetyl-2-hydroxyethyl bacteriochlorophyllide A dehydrogenase|nr:MAG: alcohol dehydrogenase [Desulfurococcaceae archaeon]GAY25296.1 alcohol dehydrogenase [Desulfurococcaceae archaeon AG1]